MGFWRPLELSNSRHQGRAEIAGLAELSTLSRRNSRILRWGSTKVRDGLVDSVPECDARVVPILSGRQHTDSALARTHDEYRRVLLPRGSASVRAADCRRPPGRVRRVSR